jgi:hypothetical protein
VGGGRVTRWEATPAERAAMLEGGRLTTAALVSILITLCILVGMALDVMT